MQSEKVNEVLAALAKAKKELKNPSKNTQGQFGKHASLEGVIEETEPILMSHDLFISAQTRYTDGVTELITMLYHWPSSQYLGSVYPLVPDQKKQDPQGMGSAMTYARRYCQLGILNLKDKDDDGMRASGAKASVGPMPGYEKPQPQQYSTYSDTAGAGDTGSADFSNHILMTGHSTVKGRKVGDLGDTDLRGYLNWMKKKEAKGITLGGAVTHDREMMKLECSKRGLEEVPEDEVPF